MTDENQSSANEGDQKVDVVQLQNELKSMAERIEAMDRKNKELLDEKKKKDEAAQAALDELEKEKARKEGDIDKLLQLERIKTEAAEKELLSIKTEIKSEKIKSLAAALANEMGGRPESIKILTKEVVEQISSLVDEKGNISDVKREIVIRNFKESAEYKPLLMGNQSTGGNAEGSSGSQSAKSLTDMSESEQIALYKQNPDKFLQLQKAAKSK